MIDHVLSHVMGLTLGTVMRVLTATRRVKVVHVKVRWAGYHPWEPAF